MRCLLIVTASAVALVSSGAAWAAPDSVDAFLRSSTLGPIRSATPVAAEESVQSAPGRHQGHRILNASFALLNAGELKPDTWSYALSYCACLELGEHQGGVEVFAREGLSGIGMSRPTGANWYSGGFIDVRIDNESLGRFRPTFQRAVHESGAVCVRASWQLPTGPVLLEFYQVPGEQWCRIRGQITGAQGRSCDIRMRCYPYLTKATGQRCAWTASAYRDKPGALVAGLTDCWFVFGDKIAGTGENARGRGPSALMFCPTELTSARANITEYPVEVKLDLRPDVDTFHLAVWEFPSGSNEAAVQSLRDLTRNLRVDIGRAASAPLRLDNVPRRALVVDRAPAATILLDPEPAERELQAAVELQDYICKVSGAVLPIAMSPTQAEGYVIRLSADLSRTGASSECFRIAVDDERTTISGNGPLAVYYGVCDLLERALGVRWYLPGPLGEIVPKHETIVLPQLDVEQSPSFPMRWIGSGAWMLRNKQNRCDDGFLIYPGIYHTQNRVVPYRALFETHPEYFALVRGQRSTDPQCKLCYGNPAVPRAAAAKLAQMTEDDPAIKLLSFSPTDGQLWCDCLRCQALDEETTERDRAKSRRSLLFYNAIAAQLRKTHPDARLLVGAYNVYNWPPADTSVRADPMLDVIITHYEDYCMAHPVPDPECPLNRRYVDLIDQWQSLGCGVYFYEYYWKVNWFDLPWPIVHSIRADIPWYKQMGHKGVFTQYNPDCIWAQFPAHYVAAKLLWDTEQDVDMIVGQMLKDLFAAASEHMLAYYGLMERQMAECGEHFPGRALSFGPAVFTAEVRSRLRAHLDAARSTTEDDTVLQRIGKVGVSLEYVDRLMAYVDLKRATQAERDPYRAHTLAGAALEQGEALINELRHDRQKWAGVVSRAILSDSGYLGRDVARWRQVVERKQVDRATVLSVLPTLWRFALDQDDVGRDRSWFAPTFDDSAWSRIEIGRTWESQGHDYDGVAWYRASVKVRPEWLKKPLAVQFGAVDGEAWVYWNGQLLGHHKGWDEPFRFELTPEAVTIDTPNAVAVRVYDGANQGGIYKMVHLVEAQ